jgi:hypothetical protein
MLYGNELDLSGEHLQFYKPRSKNSVLTQRELEEEILAAEFHGELIMINQLPSCTRICFNVILLPEPGSCSAIGKTKAVMAKVEDGNEVHTARFETKEGFVLGSAQVSLFDESFLIRQGKRELRLWPFESFNPRMVC